MNIKFLARRAFALIPCVVSLSIIYVSGLYAAGGVIDDPTGVAPDRYTYYPGTEVLKPDEIRIIACGTGMPAASPQSRESSRVR